MRQICQILFATHNHHAALMPVNAAYREFQNCSLSPDNMLFAVDLAVGQRAFTRANRRLRVRVFLDASEGWYQ